MLTLDVIVNLIHKIEVLLCQMCAKIFESQIENVHSFVLLEI